MEGEGWQGVTGNEGRRDHLVEEIARWDLHEVMPTGEVEMAEGRT